MLQASITKHGAEAHYVRPDGVMRSSVLQAIPGYHPVSNAQAVAQRFTHLIGPTAGAASAPIAGLNGGLMTLLTTQMRNAAVAKSGSGVNGVNGRAQLLRGLGSGALPPNESYNQRVLMSRGRMPTSVPTPGELAPAAPSVGYGWHPAFQRAASAGVDIAAQALRHGSDSLPPLDIFRPAAAAAAQINPSLANQPDVLARLRGVPPYVATHGRAAALEKFYGRRMGW